MLNPVTGLAPDVIGFSAEGIVTAEDYSSVLVPAVEAALEKGIRPRLLYVLGPDLERFELSAMMADARLGLSHLSDFGRIAVVTDHDWVENTVRMFGLMIPCPVRVFEYEDLSDARAWVNERYSETFTINIEQHGEEAQIHVRLCGSLDAEAEEKLIEAARQGVGNANQVRALIEVDDFHGWADLRTFWQHLRFVFGLRSRIERVAIVGDEKWQQRLVTSARNVLRVDARYFDEDHLEEARDWVEDHAHA